MRIPARCLLLTTHCLLPVANCLLLTAFCLLPTAYCSAQAPAIQWQNTIGGTLDDRLHAVKQTSDGGYILGGYSYSKNTGDKSENRIGDDDYWVVKVNSLGVIEWEETIGGTGSDLLYDIQQTADGGYILGGESMSQISGDKTENRIGGEPDYWIVKIDPVGNIEWDNTIGGTGDEGFSSLDQTSDGGYIIGGTSHSAISGDKTEGLIGDNDYWIVKLNSAGVVEWDETIGGLWDDILTSVEQTADGGYMIGGYSESDASGDKSENSIGTDDLYDYWIVKTDNLGNVEWENTLGGKKYDFLNVVKQTPDGGYIAGGYSESQISADKSENRIGDYDYWIIKLNSSGTKVWDNTIGGSDYDNLKTLDLCSDGGFILGGTSLSNISGDKTENRVGYPAVNRDYWILKLDINGIIEWDNTIGGTGNDETTTIISTADGGYVAGGYSISVVSGDKSEYVGDNDYWILKLAPEPGCNVPDGIYTDAVTTTKATVHWDVVAGATKYQVSYRPVSGGPWIKKNSLVNSKVLKDLTPNTAYEYKVKTVCAAESSPYSELFNFTTLPMREEDANNPTTNNSITNNSITIYPNPATNKFTITGNGSPLERGGSARPDQSDGGVSVEIFNSIGQLIYATQINSPDGNINETIELKNIIPGIYFIHLMTEDHLHTQKLIIQ